MNWDPCAAWLPLNHYCRSSNPISHPQSELLGQLPLFCWSVASFIIIYCFCFFFKKNPSRPFRSTLIVLPFHLPFIVTLTSPNLDPLITSILPSNTSYPSISPQSSLHHGEPDRFLPSLLCPEQSNKAHDRTVELTTTLQAGVGESTIVSNAANVSLLNLASRQNHPN